MKLLSKTIAIAALATAGLWASQASAALICAGCSYTGDTYLGAHDPNANDSSVFLNGTLGIGAFADTWLFTLNPAGDASVNANFIPGFPDPLSITGFTVTLYNVTATCGAAGTSCTGVVLGSLIATGLPGVNSSNIGFTGLTAGLYAFVVSGTVVSLPTLYSGQLTTAPDTRVPEPGSLALLGLGLLGVAAARRRTSKR